MDELTTEDRDAIRELLARYTFCIDDYDVPGFLANFLPEGILIQGDLIFQGHEGIRRFIEGRGNTPMRKHLVGEPVVDGNAQRCSVRAYCTVVAYDPAQGCMVTSVNEYHDVCVKVAGTWLFEKRTIQLDLGASYQPIAST